MRFLCFCLFGCNILNSKLKMTSLNARGMLANNSTEQSTVEKNDAELVAQPLDRAQLCRRGRYALGTIPPRKKRSMLFGSTALPRLRQMKSNAAV